MYSKKRKEHYEDNNFPEYERIMKSRGFSLLFKTDPNKVFTPYDNLIIGDGVWLKNEEVSFRDLKICGTKYNCPVSENSIKNFGKNGWYDFYDPFFSKTVFSISKENLLALYDAKKWYVDSSDNNLIRFYYQDIKELAE